MDQMTLQQVLGYRFNDASLLELALTHTSWSNEQGLEHHNERIEFLGDAVLELCVSATLYQRFSAAREGDLTRLRSQLVNTVVLARLARQIGVDGVLRLGKGEERQGGRQRDALLADAMEAVLGGIFLDGGFEAVQDVVNRVFEELWPTIVGTARKKDCKSRLQEVTQQLLRSLPVYTLLESIGPEHGKTFTAKVEVADGRVWIGRASSVKRAEHEAAKLALLELTAQADAGDTPPESED